MRSGVGWEEDESIGWELKKVRKYFSASKYQTRKYCPKRGCEEISMSWSNCKQKKWKWAFYMLGAGSDSDVTLMAILCCCLMFSRLETIYREKLWEHFRTNDHDRSCGTLNIKSNRANIPSVCWNSPWILIAIPLFFSQSKAQKNCWNKNSLRDRELQWSTCHGW